MDSVSSSITDSPVAPASYTIAEASQLTGVSTETLRYYERAGLMPDVARTEQGHRAYSADDLGWIAFVRRLRSTGMPMRRVAEYTGMVRRGDGTVTERRRLLEEHRATVASALDELAEALHVLDNKIAHYEAAERGVDVGCADEPLRFVRQLG